MKMHLTPRRAYVVDIVDVVNTVNANNIGNISIRGGCISNAVSLLILLALVVLLLR